MGRLSRNKGAAGEREALAILGALLGVTLRRNLSQVRESGPDCIEVMGWGIEIKRQKRIDPSLDAWWDQAVRNAEVSELRPALIYRLDRHPWRAIVHTRDFVPGFEGQERTLHFAAEMSMECFSEIIRRY